MVLRLGASEDTSNDVSPAAPHVHEAVDTFFRNHTRVLGRLALCRHTLYIILAARGIHGNRHTCYRMWRKVPEPITGQGDAEVITVYSKPTCNKRLTQIGVGVDVSYTGIMILLWKTSLSTYLNQF